MINFLYPFKNKYAFYDIETYPNTFTFFCLYEGQEFLFEISDRVDQKYEFVCFLNELVKRNIHMVGFNNYGFDYPVVHFIYQNYNIITIKDIYDKAMQIINNFDQRFQHIIWDDQQIVPQVDLFKIHHFDNKARMTSLKVLEFNMRSNSIEDLPFPVGMMLDDEQKDVLIEYNKHDVYQTAKFFFHSAEQILFREGLTEKYQHNFMNHNDTKIGKDYFIMTLEKHNPGSCYKHIDGRKTVVQTKRNQINLGDVVLQYIKFDNPEFNRILNFFKNKTIRETKGVFEGLNCTIKGFQFDFGTGGIHGSIKKKMVESDEQNIVEDWDVASYYPNLAIANNFYPAHLGLEFCEIYKEVYEQRKQHKKGTSENATLKLALNGVYGDSNNQYSPFYDPQYTMSITINGQLLLCMIADQLLSHQFLELVQINTDGLTIRYPRTFKQYVHQVMKWWEDLSGLTLENVEYKRMYVRDVNNYVAVPVNGKVKRKGAYDFDLGWHQNHSALIIPKAVSEYLVNGISPGHYIRSCTDPFEFCLRTKIQRSHKLLWGGEQIQNVSRYYISEDGDILEKLLPAKGPLGAFKRANGLTDEYFNTIQEMVGHNRWDPRIHTKNKSKYEERKTSIHQGHTVQICNKIDQFNFDDLDYNYYIKEAHKLIKDCGGDL